MEPFYTVRVNNEYITYLISGFSYEDCTDEDDLLHITLNAVADDILDSDLLQVGNDIEFQFGIRGGAYSPLRVMRISDVDYTYSKSIGVVIKAFDYGQLLKKAQSNKVWSNKTASDIAIEIARKYSLDTKFITPTSFRYTTLPQATKTDFELLNYLVDREEAGSFIWYIKSNALHFKKLELDQPSMRTFVYGENVISFKPSFKDAQNELSTKTANILDPLTKKTTEIVIDTQNAKEQVFMGKQSNSTTPNRQGERKLPMYDANGKIVK